MRLFSVLLGVVFLFIGQAAHGAPYLDPALLNSLDTDKNRTIPTILVFSKTKKMLNELKAPQTRAQTLITMRKQTQNSIEGWKQNNFWAETLEVNPIWILNGASVKLSESQIQALRNDPSIQGIYLGSKPYKLKKDVQAALATREEYTYGLKKIGVEQVRKTYPQLNGAGVRVGILDTGITITHPDLQGKLKLFKNFSPATDNSPVDDFGHGTHVSGTIVGGDASGEAIGVAPGAGLIMARIFDGNGESTREQILNAMQWMADPDGNPNSEDYAQVVNNSWGDDDPYADRLPENEPFCQIINSYVKLNMIPVFSAGNTGPAAGTINLPAGCPNSFSVGATEQNDQSPHFSSTGPAVWKGINIMKPEVCAPGFHIKSARKYGGYEEMSGTSMAAPHVTGAFAILLQAYPKATAEEIKTAMLAGALDLGNRGQDGVFGWGRIDLMKSLEKLKQK